MTGQTFRYRAWDPTGKLVSGTMQGETRDHVVERLRNSGYFVSSLEPVRERRSLFQRPRMMPPKDAAIFCRQFAIMMDTGMPVVSALNTLADQQAHPPTKEAIESVARRVMTGEGLAESFRRHDKIFAEMFINMVELGEESGNLAEILNRLAVYYEKEAKLRGDVKQALTYPTVVTSFAIIAVAVILFGVLPVFGDLFADFDAELPLLTRVILDTQRWATDNIIFVILGIMLIIVLIRYYIRTHRGRRVKDALILKIPIGGELIQKVILSRFARTLSLLVTSGIGMVQSLEVLERIVGNTVVADDVVRARVGVEHGRGLSEPLREGKTFPSMLVDIIAVGEETGGLEHVLIQMSDFYDQEVDRTVQGLTSIIEPIIIAALGGIIGIIVAAVFMPMFDLVNVVQ